MMGQAVLIFGVILCGVLLAAGTASAQQEPADSEKIFGWIEKLCESPHRRPGSVEDHRTAYYVARKFIEFGLEDVRIEPVPLDVWTAREWSLETDATGSWQPTPCFFGALSAFTPPEGLEAEMVYIAGDEDERWTEARGKIVVVDIPFPRFVIDLIRTVSLYVHDPGNSIEPGRSQPNQPWPQALLDAYARASENGAAGLVAILSDLYGNQCEWYGLYDGVTKEVPAVHIGRDDGARLRQAVQERTVRGRLRLTGTNEPGLTENILGWARGTGDDAIIVQCHHDSPFTGGTEDGSGMGILLALAQYAGSRPTESRDKNWLFLATAGHFHGSIGGRTFVERHRKDILPRVKAVFVPEHIALETAEVDGKPALTGHPETSVLWVSEAMSMQEKAIETVKRYDLVRTHVLPAHSAIFPNPIGESDHYSELDVPVVQLMSGPLYLFTSDDTLDKVAVDRLEPTARAFIDMIEHVDRSPDTGKGKKR